MTRRAVVTRGRAPALVPLTESMTAAGILVREVWCEEDLETLTARVPLDRTAVAPGALWRSDMRRADVVLERLRQMPDVALIAEAFLSRRIASPILDRLPVMNVHPAPLPRYRGAHPIPWQIIRGETDSAVTFHLATAEIDAGPILRASPFGIDPTDNYGDVLTRVLEVLRRDGGAVVRGFLEGTIQPQEQNHAAATYVVKRAPDDGWIDWQWSADEIRNFVRALTEPLPGAWTLWNGRHVVMDEVDADERFGAYVGRTLGQVAGLGDARGILTHDGAVVPVRVRDAETGRDVTPEIRVNDRFHRNPIARRNM